MSIVNSDDGAGAVKVQVQSAIARILHMSRDIIDMPHAD